MRYFITLSYDGTRYHGWQIQPNGISVQGELQRALSLLLRHDVMITGAGRTDAGVHAHMMVAHFDIGDNHTDSNLEASGQIDCRQLTYKLNRLLPADIAIQSIQRVPADMHARFSATSRTYYYYLHTHKSPFLRHYSCELHYDLDFGLMNQAAQLLLGYDDFGAFCKSHTDVKTTICKVTKAEWRQLDSHQWLFEITANRFLRNMVRAVVGTLVEVGRKRLTISDFQRVVEGKRRSDAGESMPANALFLERIEY
ncbi:MAG: tRNA pseudouridine(38-40) synthase TruA [Prevotella sp.]|nr:tRNA pseudouridine(38-40) synthase TruA [Prevotella sp.]